ncbi:PPOX class F420-dependent oxidoreductase [Naumannella cuiyingiana]|uniref:PPOX class probable F420-dependent enzyme n=1 Tax=Naumannella cuiyingiana TaxID=1347891 RepID=A0A7Z0DCB5_9ACTN|nr:PPOX class F420-dependent oxidoreductase [Naumannella cuiyingiana]NYI72699.1 PPOX class probable F420-dependent enzyme [Naumannella cuiyingiana]
MATELTDHQRRLLEQPIYASLGTTRPDGTPQVNPMWFGWDGGDTIRFTHIPGRAKYRNLQANPAMSLMLLDPDNPFSYIEVRGRLVGVDPDPTGAYYVELQNRYGNPSTTPPPDAADRIVLQMSIDKVIGQ